MYGRGTSERRVVVIAVLLTIAFGFSALLTWRALTAGRAHRAAAEAFVRDYAAVVGDDLLRRTVFEFEEFAIHPTRVALLSRLRRDGLLMSAGELKSQIVERTFVADFTASRVEPPLPPLLQAWVLREMESAISDRVENDKHFQIRVRLAAGDHFIAFCGTAAAPRKYIGFTLRPEVLAALSKRAYGRRTPFPGQYAAKSHLRREDVFIHITQGSLELLRTAGRFDPALGLRFSAPADYGGLVGGSIVEVSFARSALGGIVPGGLPTSNVFLAVVAFISVALVLIAIGIVVRQERQLATLRADFISGISHELRTPLTQIRMFSETLMLNRVRTDRERQRSLQIVNQETSRLSHLVDNLLLLSRRERGVLDLSLQKTDVSQLVRDTVDGFEPFMRSRKTKICVRPDDGLIAVLDPNSVKQVLINLLDNSVKYGPSGQTITVALSQVGGKLRIDVDDEGPGIPAGERNHVWEKFFRLQRDRETHKAGSGIGLAVSAEIIQRHGGQYMVSDAPGGGARFTIVLPMDRAIAPVEDELERRFFEDLESSARH